MRPQAPGVEQTAGPGTSQAPLSSSAFSIPLSQVAALPSSQINTSFRPFSALANASSSRGIEIPAFQPSQLSLWSPPEPSQLRSQPSVSTSSANHDRMNAAERHRAVPRQLPFDARGVAQSPFTPHPSITIPTNSRTRRIHSQTNTRTTVAVSSSSSQILNVDYIVVIQPQPVSRLLDIYISGIDRTIF